ncbi:MAG: thiamine-phosphate kinase [Deltaproteobacteria bacterium]
MINELSALRLIEEQFQNASKCVEVGIGDDSAGVRIGAGKILLATTDCQVENVHFVKSLISPAMLARKSVAVSVSDIGAMGGVPKFILASLGFPKDENESLIDELISGFRSSEEEFGVRLIGGNLSSSEKLFLDVTALGEVDPDNLVRRSGASAGDSIYVSGTLGDSALGMKFLGNAKEVKEASYLIARHLSPEPRLALGKELAERGLATSMIDVSDGLLLDLERITVNQGLGAEVRLTDVPVSADYDEFVSRYSGDRYELALSGGEDYELLFTSPSENSEQIDKLSHSLDLSITEIGRVTSEDLVRVIDANGDEISLNRRGFVHSSN